MVRAARVRKAGLPISTLALAEPLLDPPLGFLSKYGIRAIRGAEAGRTRSTGASAVGLTPLRFGLWQLACDARLCGGPAIAQWFVAARIRRAIDRRIRGGAPFHLAIDTAALAGDSNVDRMGNLAGLLRHIQPPRARRIDPRSDHFSNDRPVVGARRSASRPIDLAGRLIILARRMHHGDWPLAVSPL